MTAVGDSHMSLVFLIAFVVYCVMTLFFWFRGVLRGTRGDLLVALLLMVVFVGTGWVLVLAGLGTVVLGAFRRQGQMRNRVDASRIGWLLTILGVACWLAFG